MSSIRHPLVLLSLAVLVAAPVMGVVWEERSSARGEKIFRDPQINIFNAYQPLSALAAELAQERQEELVTLGVAPSAAFLDVRSLRWGTLVPSRPLVPGSGVGNDLEWSSLGMETPSSSAELKRAIWESLAAYLRAHQAALRVDLGELPSSGRVTLFEDGAKARIWAPRIHDGIRVRDSYVSAAMNHGNLVLFGVHGWGELQVNTTPTLSVDEALRELSGYLGEPVVFSRNRAYLEIVPTAVGERLEDVRPGAGYGYRLAWVVHPRFEGDASSWEALVDAHSGEVLAFEDLNDYATRREVIGGVHPVSNDGEVPDGVEQAGWPMPYVDVTVGAQVLFSDAGGNLGVCADGEISTALDGQFVSIFDNCGVIDESSNAGIDLGTSGGTDCTVPAGHSPGDTHASRDTFFHANQAKEQGRGWWDENEWLEEMQLTANVNINNACNAFWNGSTINFYRNLGTNCGNTGELMGVIVHEWGHGMDGNDAMPFTSNPGEGIADIYAFVRNNDSCMGRGFIASGANCGGYGDPCTDCSGIREVDWAKRNSGQPHDITSPFPIGIDALCGAGSSTPCGGVTHCEGAVYAEAVWDLIKRDLPAAPFNMDDNTALEVVTRMTYLGASPVNNWFQCVADFGGCNSDGGYLNYLAADDDNGNLNDGTPHMTAIFDAFDRHEIACNVPTVQNGGCAGTPTTAPSVTATPLDKAVQLEWGPVAGATRYDIFRAENVAQCDYGKSKVGETTGLEFVDEGLLNGREYSYVVIPMGAGESCFGPASSCTSASPVAGPNVSIDTVTADLDIVLGDGDPFLDNCEEGKVSFDVFNIGTGAVTNVRLVNVEPVSHPSTLITSPLPTVLATSLSSCNIAAGSFTFQARDLAVDDVLEFRIDVTSDELGGIVKSGTVRIPGTEGDLEFFASKTFTFESDMEGWEVIQGIFDRTNEGGGGNGTAFYLSSSDNLPDQCDQVRSPAMVLGSTSTLSLWNSFDIEAEFPPWYDRANIGVFGLDSQERTPISPDSGRLYNATGDNGTCGTTGQDGWADSMPPWDESGFSSMAVGGDEDDGLVQLHVYYGTDPLEHGFGFHFDEVTVTDVSLQAPDTQSDVCQAPVFLFSDDFESGDTSAWDSSVQ